MNCILANKIRFLESVFNLFQICAWMVYSGLHDIAIAHLSSDCIATRVDDLK